MTLKIVSNNGQAEVHSVRIDDGVITIIAIADGADVHIDEMESLFPNFTNIIHSASETSVLLGELQRANSDYIWAHVSGKL